MRHPQLPLVILLTLAALGCQDERAWLRRGLVEPLDAQRLGYRSLWRTDLALSSGARLTSVQVLGEMIVLTESPRNLVTAVDVGTGNIRWTQPVGQPGKLLFAPRRLGDRIVVNNETTLYVLDANSGAVRQANALQTVVSSAPAVSGNLAIFAGMNGRLFAQDTVTGQPVWAYQMPSAMEVAPSADQDVVLAADAAGNYKALSASRGALLWTGRTFARISARPLVTPLGAFIASEDTHLYALDVATGKERWNYLAEHSLHIGPLMLGETVYQAIDGRGLTALDAVTGRKLWSLAETAVPILHRGQQVVVYAPPRLMTVEAGTGLPRAAAVVGLLQAVVPGPQQSLILVGGRGRLERLDNQL